MQGDEDRLEDLARRLQRLEREDRVKRRWHSDPAILISLSALLFSLTTTLFSYYQARQAEVRAARTEVRQLAQRISVAPREALDLWLKTGDPQQRQSIEGMVALETALIANQAREIMADLPADAVRPTEQLTVGQALISNYRVEEGLALLTDAIGGADDLQTKTNALRQRGFAYFGMGKAEAGRADYRAALAEVQREAGQYSLPVVQQNLAFTNLAWAQAEYMLGNLAETQARVSEARLTVDGMPPGPIRDQLLAQVMQYEAALGTTAAP